jgi:hypothetical protein
LEHAFLTLKHLAYAQEIDIFYTQLGSAMEARVQHALQIIAASDYSKAAQLESRQLINSLSHELFNYYFMHSLLELYSHWG